MTLGLTETPKTHSELVDEVYKLELEVSSLTSKVHHLQFEMKTGAEIMLRDYPKPFDLKTYAKFYLQWIRDRDRWIHINKLLWVPPKPSADTF